MTALLLFTATFALLQWSGPVRHTACTEWRLNEDEHPVGKVETCPGVPNLPQHYAAYAHSKSLGEFDTLDEAKSKVEATVKANNRADNGN